jgi:hypothetical protein
MIWTRIVIRPQKRLHKRFRFVLVETSFLAIFYYEYGGWAPRYRLGIQGASGGNKRFVKLGRGFAQYIPDFAASV